MRFSNIPVLLLVIFFTSGLSFFLARSITNPIRTLRDAVIRISRGEFTRIKIESKDEIGELAVTFNKMSEDLRKSYTALMEAKTTLEIRVEARTKELEELNQSLDEQVKERTKELQKKLEELEKFNKLTVGRELKMISLKEEIKKFKKNK